MRVSVIAVILCISGCAKKKVAVPPTFTTTLITVTSSVHNLFSPTHAPMSSADCSSALSLQVRIYDVGAFVLAPGQAQPLSSCPVAADGSFTCDHIDISKDSAGLLGLYDDVNNAVSDCVAASATVFLPCSSKDLSDSGNTACGAGHALDDGTISETETSGAFVIPQNIWQGIDTQAQSTSTAATFAPLAQTGAVLTLVLDANGQPFPGAQPYLPKSCEDKWQCRTFFPTSVGPLDLTATQTSSAGMWLAQVVTHDTSGAIEPVVGDISTLEEPDEKYGAIDCSATHASSEQCFSLLPGKAIAANERGAGTPAVVFVNVETSATAVNAHCPLYNALIAAKIDPATLACP